MPKYEILFHKEEIVDNDFNSVKTTAPKILKLIAVENGLWVSPKKLKYFHCPNPSACRIDLNTDNENDFKPGEISTKQSFEKLVKYLMANEETMAAFSKKTHNNKIITTRSVIKYIMNTPYRLQDQKRNNWTIKATKFGNVIYMRKAKGQMWGNQLGIAHHYKFHQYCFSDSPEQLPDANKPYDENDLFYGLLEYKVDNFDILYSSNMMGVESKGEIADLENENTLEKCKFVKTKLFWEHLFKFNYNWRSHRELLSLWLQSYLSNVENMYVGFKTEDGLVERQLSRVKTRTFPIGQSWQPEVCERFLRDFLEKVQLIMDKIDCPYTVYEFDFCSAKGTIMYRIFEGKSEHSFLSDELIQFI